MFVKDTINHLTKSLCPLKRIESLHYQEKIKDQRVVSTPITGFSHTELVGIVALTTLTIHTISFFDYPNTILAYLKLQNTITKLKISYIFFNDQGGTETSRAYYKTIDLWLSNIRDDFKVLSSTINTISLLALVQARSCYNIINSNYFDFGVGLASSIMDIDLPPSIRLCRSKFNNSDTFPKITVLYRVIDP
eukprot:gene20523-24634_t